MIESIYQIGRAVLERGGGRHTVLESLADNPPTDKEQKSYIAILKLDTSGPKLDLDIRELGREVENTAARYLWLGNLPANSPQARLTTDNLSYLISQIIPNLLKNDRVIEDTLLYRKLKQLEDELYLDLGEPGELGVKPAGFNQYKLLWNLQKLGIDGPSLEELQERVRGGEKPKTIPQQAAKAISNHFKHELPVEGVLFTLEVDGELLVDDEAYQEYLERSLVDNAFEGSQEGQCHLSGERGPVTTEMTRFKFKYYITDKLGFAAGATKNGFGSNFALSRDAYRALLVGERVVRRELRFYFAGASAYVIPDLYTVEIPKKLPDALLKTLRGIRSRTMFELGRLQAGELDDGLEDYMAKYHASGYMLNLLFYWATPGRSDFTILRLIQDIPEYRLKELRQQGIQTGRLWEGLYGRSAEDLTLQQIYYLLPVRAVRDPDGRVQYLNKEILSFYHTLISGGLLERKRLVGQFLELVRAYRFGNTDSYQVWEPGEGYEDLTLTRYVAQSSLLLAFLKELDQLKEEEMSQEYIERLDLDPQEEEYLQRLGYGPEQAALYLLGSLVAEIANAQWRLGPDGRNGEKTILNKINYQGMTPPRVRRLATELFEKLRQYHYTNRDGQRRPLLQAHTETRYAKAQELIEERQKEGWSLTPDENVYYLLSGYSHRTLRAMSGSTQTTDTAEKGA